MYSVNWCHCALLRILLQFEYWESKRQITTTTTTTTTTAHSLSGFNLLNPLFGLKITGVCNFKRCQQLHLLYVFCMISNWSRVKKSNFIQIIVWRKQNAHNFLRKTKHIHTKSVFRFSTFWGYTQRNHSKMILTATFLDKPIVRQVNEINYDWLFWFEWVRGGNWTNYF